MRLAVRLECDLACIVEWKNTPKIRTLMNNKEVRERQLRKNRYIKKLESETDRTKRAVLDPHSVPVQVRPLYHACITGRPRDFEVCQEMCAAVHQQIRVLADDGIDRAREEELGKLRISLVRRNDVLYRV